MLYIHVPFCHSKCYYCDFCSIPSPGGEGDLSARISAYTRQAVREYLARRGDASSSFSAPETVYIGGGTPSLLPTDAIDSILEHVDLSRLRELTIEANPEDVTPQWARWIAYKPAARVSMGVQSLVDSELKAIGRRHTADTAIRAFHTLRDAGVGNISLDLMYGLPGQTLASWAYSLRTLLDDLRPDHLSAYLLSIEPATRFSALLSAGRLQPASPLMAESMYRMLCRNTRRRSYIPYEISNFALPGRESRHNSAYWTTSTPYLGIGPGAHTFDGRERRFFNRPLVPLYLTKGFEATLVTEQLSAVDRINEFILTSLRTLRGLSLEECARRFGKTVADDLLGRAAGPLRRGTLARTADNRLFIPLRHRLISDNIIVDLILDDDSEED